MFLSLFRRNALRTVGQLRLGNLVAIKLHAAKKLGMQKWEETFANSWIFDSGPTIFKKSLTYKKSLTILLSIQSGVFSGKMTTKWFSSFQPGINVHGSEVILARKQNVFSSEEITNRQQALQWLRCFHLTWSHTSITRFLGLTYKASTGHDSRPRSLPFVRTVIIAGISFRAILPVPKRREPGEKHLLSLRGCNSCSGVRNKYRHVNHVRSKYDGKKSHRSFHSILARKCFFLTRFATARALSQCHLQPPSWHQTHCSNFFQIHYSCSCDTASTEGEWRPTKTVGKISKAS